MNYLKSFNQINFLIKFNNTNVNDFAKRINYEKETFNSHDLN